MNQNETLNARVVRQERGAWTVNHNGQLHIVRHLRGAVPPVVGDAVELSPTLDSIVSVLPRRTLIARRAPGGVGEVQVLAANAELALIVMGLDGDYNPRRLERYLVMALAAGARPAVLLNKQDLCANTPARVAESKAIAGEAPVLALCALTGDLHTLMSGVVEPGETAVLLGSSGAGKSTLANRLLGRDGQAMSPVRAGDSRGRHTTTARSLIEMPDGWALIDMPGLREVGLLPGDGHVEKVFSGLAALARGCRFRDCTHTVEPGCAVRAGAPPEQLASFVKLKEESREDRTRQMKTALKTLRAARHSGQFSKW